MGARYTESSTCENCKEIIVRSVINGKKYDWRHNSNDVKCKPTYAKGPA